MLSVTLALRHLSPTKAAAQLPALSPPTILRSGSAPRLFAVSRGCAQCAVVILQRPEERGPPCQHIPTSPNTFFMCGPGTIVVETRNKL